MCARALVAALVIAGSLGSLASCSGGGNDGAGGSAGRAGSNGAGVPSAGAAGSGTQGGASFGGQVGGAGKAGGVSVAGASAPGGSTGSAGAGTGGEVSCGEATCGAEQYCCNASCSLCAPHGSACIQIVCDPPETGGACQSPDDCRLFDDYCTGCDCRALAQEQPDPSCSGPGVRCLVAPCEGRAADCQNGRCVALPAP